MNTMKKLLFKIYGFNLLISIVLFFAQRFFITKSYTTQDSWFYTILNIIDVWLNLAWSTVFLIVAVLGSLSLFLNLNKNIRTHYFLSLLTFSGIPLIYFIYLLFPFFSGFKYDFDIDAIPLSMTMAAVFAAAYLLLSIGEFLMFRKKRKFIFNKNLER